MLSGGSFHALSLSDSCAFLKVNQYNHPCMRGAGSYHFMSLTGNPVGVAKDLQLHIRLQKTTANTDGKKSETARVETNAEEVRLKKCKFIHFFFS